MRDYHQFISKKNMNFLESGMISCTAPSNIALVKYWGKKDLQLPENPSISFTLDVCKTETTLRYEKLENISPDFNFELYFEGKPKPGFNPKIYSFLERIEPYMPFLKQYKFTIETRNTFPHSSGIASSASGMSALAFCLVQLENKLLSDLNQAQLLQKASFLARLGSGSACRSIEGPITVWGAHSKIEGSNDAYAIKFPFTIHKNFYKYQDTILLIDIGQKQVSSSVGHGLMHGHWFAEKRFEQALHNGSRLTDALISGDMDIFIEVVESEALTLHAMMMTSLPYFILMKPNTLSVIHKVWEYRKKTGSKLCFTLDAGANVHLLYPEWEQKEVIDLINNELVAYCQKGQYICDKIGFGVYLV